MLVNLDLTLGELTKAAGRVCIESLLYGSAVKVAAARTGQPEIAVEALLTEAGSRNGYDVRGVNTGGPCP